MELALKKMATIAGRADEMHAANYHELTRVNEAKHLVKYCDLMIKACLERKESGHDCYKRVDYPNPDPAWENKMVVLWQEDGKQKVAAEEYKG